jgi:hypothetical protein
MELRYAPSSEEYPPLGLAARSVRGGRGFTFAFVSDQFHPWLLPRYAGAAARVPVTE